MYHQSSRSRQAPSAVALSGYSPPIPGETLCRTSRGEAVGCPPSVRSAATRALHEAPLGLYGLCSLSALLRGRLCRCHFDASVRDPPVRLEPPGADSDRPPPPAPAARLRCAISRPEVDRRPPRSLYRGPPRANSTQACGASASHSESESGSGCHWQCHWQCQCQFGSVILPLAV